MPLRESTSIWKVWKRQRKARGSRWCVIWRGAKVGGQTLGGTGAWSEPEGIGTCCEAKRRLGETGVADSEAMQIYAEWTRANEEWKDKVASGCCRSLPRLASPPHCQRDVDERQHNRPQANHSHLLFCFLSLQLKVSERL